MYENTFKDKQLWIIILLSIIIIAIVAVGSEVVRMQGLIFRELSKLNYDMKSGWDMMNQAEEVKRVELR